MQSTLMVSEEERQLLLELLAEERRELHPEIHHTDNRSMRHELKDRLVMVEHLLERMQSVPVR